MTVRFNERPFSSWGRVVRRRQEVGAIRFQDEIDDLLSRAGANGSSAVPLLPVGLARSYGDSCLNSTGRIVDMTGLDRILNFDKDAGTLRVEAGASIDAILRVIVPQGYFLTTTPGSRFVTAGGAVANDVHGKNHVSAGSFGLGVRRIALGRSDSAQLEISRDSRPDLFAATIGGLGLTGIIKWVEVDLAPIESAYMDIERTPFSSLDEFFDLSEREETAEHTVAWVDGASTGRDLGRGIYQRSDWRRDGILEPHGDGELRTVPMDAPGWLLNRYSLRAFNTLYYNLQKRARNPVRVHYGPALYPLDSIRNWNRLYGRRGFYQYQCVIPLASAKTAMHDILSAISTSGTGSLLAVLKKMGSKASPGLISFPMQGYTFAMDFPNRDRSTLELMARLDAIVTNAGGRLYPAKDGRMPKHMFQSGYPRWREFAEFVDPVLGSDFWRRVSL